MKYYIFIIATTLLFSCTQKKSNEKSILKPASYYFPNDKTQVLVVGTFHFNYPGLDVNKTEDEDKIDVLVEPKKSEVTELVEYIKSFKPNKIAIEAFDSWNATEKLRGYNNGEYRDERDERYQLAIRIAAELKLDTLYSINAQSYDNDLMKLDTTYFDKLFLDFDFKSDDPFNELYQKWFESDSKLIPKVNLLDFLKHLNSKESHQYGFGVYLVGDFKLDNHRGADILSIWWYNRNLRIFRKLQEITEDKNDRILVIIGNGHAEILRQLIESSPEYEFIEFDSIK
jgi:hypothetical protein